jgi:hypothetical protein
VPAIDVIVGGVTAWRDVERAEPQFAHRVRALFDAHRHKTIATVRADGSPRISGIKAAFECGELVFGSMVNARKGADLRRDPRLALHSAAVDPVEGAEVQWPREAKISGRAIPAGLPSTPPRLSRRTPAARGGSGLRSPGPAAVRTAGPGSAAGRAVRRGRSRRAHRYGFAASTSVNRAGGVVVSPDRDDRLAGLQRLPQGAQDVPVELRHLIPFTDRPGCKHRCDLGFRVADMRSVPTRSVRFALLGVGRHDVLHGQR